MRTEVRRGCKFIEYHDPDTQPEGTYTQEISCADVNYQDEQGSWQAIDENWVTDGLDGYIVKVDKLNHKVRLKGTGGRAWYPRRNVTTEYVTFGVPQYWTGSKWSNFGFSGWSVDGKTITLNTKQNVTILVHSRWNGVKIDWVLANTSAPIRMRYAVGLTGITETDGVLYGADGTRLASLTPTTATDANGVELACNGSYSGGYVEFQVDVTGAAFPVVVDPDFTQKAGDDTIVFYTNPTYNYGAYNYLQTDNGRGGRYSKILIRFDLSSIGAEYQCTAAKLAMYVQTSTTVNITYSIYKIADANGDWIEGTRNAAVALSGEPCWNAKEANGSGGVTTAWAGSAGLSTAGTDYINTILGSYTGKITSGTWMEVSFNSSGLNVLADWFGDSTNNGLLITQDNDTYMSEWKSSEYSSYEPKLTVTYTTGGALLKVNMAAQMQQLSGGFN